VPSLRRPVSPPALWPFIAAFTVMLVLVAAAIVLIVAFDGSGEEVGKQLLPASVVGLVVAIVAAILDNHIQERSAAEAARERVLRELVTARDLLEEAHLLIQAHRCGTTYRDQLVGLVHAQGAMRFARALVQATSRDKKVFEVDLLAGYLRQVFDFLGEVADEYRKRYVEVAKAEETGSESAWRIIESFPHLQRFLDPQTFEDEVRHRLREAVKSVQISSGGVRTTTPGRRR
jgi:hypothetical protein